MGTVMIDVILGLVILNTLLFLTIWVALLAAFVKVYPRLKLLTNASTYATMSTNVSTGGSLKRE